VSVFVVRIAGKIFDEFVFGNHPMQNEVVKDDTSCVVRVFHDVFDFGTATCNVNKALLLRHFFGEGFIPFTEVRTVLDV
jgi:hypothetical protein